MITLNTAAAGNRRSHLVFSPLGGKLADWVDGWMGLNPERLCPLRVVAGGFVGGLLRLKAVVRERRGGGGGEVGPKFYYKF
jgi:hypothetical protein